MIWRKRASEKHALLRRNILIYIRKREEKSIKTEKDEI
jgi:hypothetical protein